MPGPTPGAQRPTAGSQPASRTRPLATAALWEQLSGATSLAEFAPIYLDLLVAGVRGATQALLLLGPADRGPYELVGLWPNGTEPSAELRLGAEHALAQRKGLVGGAASKGGQARRGARPSMVAQPVEIHGRIHGVVVLELSPRPEAELRQLLHQIRWATGWIDSLLQRHGGAPEISARARFEAVLQLLSSALDGEDFQRAATAFVTELATVLHCERVCLAFEHKRRMRVAAISHSANPDTRANLVRAVEAAMEEAFDQRASVVYPACEGVEGSGVYAHHDLMREYGATSVCTVLFAGEGEHHGALTLERNEAAPFDQVSLELCEAAAEFAGPILSLKRRHDRPPQKKLLDALGDGYRKLVGPRYTAGKLAAGGLALLLLLLLVVRGDYRVTADALLEPSVLRAAVAPFAGYVAQAPVRAGDGVMAGDLLGAVDDRDMQLERVKWESEREQLLKQYRQALAERNAPQSEIASASLEEAEAELQRIVEQLSRTALHAPFDGIVVSGDLSQRLGAPVERGEVLFEVAPLDAYRLILQVDERDIAEVAPGQLGQIKFSSLPNASYPFEVGMVTPVAVSEEGRNYFRVEARLEEPDARLRPAIEGVSKIEIDRRSLAWIWTHEAIDWLRLLLWRWLP